MAQRRLQPEACAAARAPSPSPFTATSGRAEAPSSGSRTSEQPAGKGQRSSSQGSPCSSAAGAGRAEEAKSEGCPGAASRGRSSGPPSGEGAVAALKSQAAEVDLEEVGGGCPPPRGVNGEAFAGPTHGLKRGEDALLLGRPIALPREGAVPGGATRSPPDGQQCLHTVEDLLVRAAAAAAAGA